MNMWGFSLRREFKSVFRYTQETVFAANWQRPWLRQKKTLVTSVLEVGSSGMSKYQHSCSVPFHTTYWRGLLHVTESSFTSTGCCGSLNFKSCLHKKLLYTIDLVVADRISSIIDTEARGFVFKELFTVIGFKLLSLQAIETTVVRDSIFFVAVKKYFQLRRVMVFEIWECLKSHVKVNLVHFQPVSYNHRDLDSRSFKGIFHFKLAFVHTPFVLSSCCGFKPPTHCFCCGDTW